MKRPKSFIAFLCIVSAIIGGGVARGGEDVRVLRYDERHGNGPTLIVRGRGCLQSEDSMRLRPVAYVGGGVVGGSDDLIVYRCR